jgi:hypothetical protein
MLPIDQLSFTKSFSKSSPTFGRIKCLEWKGRPLYSRAFDGLVEQDEEVLLV